MTATVLAVCESCGRTFERAPNSGVTACSDRCERLAIAKERMAQRAARRAALLERYCAGDAREER